MSKIELSIKMYAFHSGPLAQLPRLHYDRSTIEIRARLLQEFVDG